MNNKSAAASTSIPRCSLLHEKNRRPRGSSVRKISDFQVRDQGFEPWTP